MKHDPTAPVMTWPRTVVGQVNFTPASQMDLPPVARESLPNDERSLMLYALTELRNKRAEQAIERPSQRASLSVEIAALDQLIAKVSST